MERLRIELPIEPMIAPGILGLPILEPHTEILPAEFAYTKAQKNWLDRAFGHTYYSIARGIFLPIRQEEVNWHHILPAAYIIEVFHCDPNQIIPNKGFLPIPLTKREHLDLIHPDMAQAIREYHQDPESIKKAVKRHHELAKQGKVFWNNRYDAVLMTASRIKISDYMRSNPSDKFPKDPSWEKKNGRRQ